MVLERVFGGGESKEGNKKAKRKTKWWSITSFRGNHQMVYLWKLFE